MKASLKRAIESFRATRRYLYDDRMRVLTVPANHSSNMNSYRYRQILLCFCHQSIVEEHTATGNYTLNKYMCEQTLLDWRTLPSLHTIQ